VKIGITCFPTFGGSGIVATEIGLGMARRGHRVHFICAEVPFRLDRYVDNVFFHEVAARDYPLFDQSPYALALTSKMVEVSTWEKLDLLHVHYAIPHAASAYLAKQILGEHAPKVITTLHGTDITVVGNDPSFLPITKFSIAHSDAVTTPSESLKNDTLALVHRPIDVIPNFVDTELYKPGQRTGKLVVHNSNFRPVKRVDDVIAVFSQLPKDTQLALIGDGPERSRLERAVHDLGLADRVRFLGKQLSFIEVLQSASVFLLTSELESFGLAALEALSCGVPVVATRVGGIPEVISDGGNGSLHDLGDVRGMAASVKGLLDDPALHARMSAAARATAVGKFSLEPMIDRWEAYYRKVTS
jgi:N-acetyl-alpha-D-glucosaminyl L-malate synthase BshA